MKIDFPQNYKGFELISINEVPDCASTGIYLRHKKTGLEVFHLLNEDSENLFAFAFRTPVKDSTGAAHIMEHSVFCGSEKFPLKEPFTNMMNQSVNTFLNALTYSDKTVYPAASTIKNDYFNLMDVYADAVFFPLLKKEAFMQEAHRLELNDKGEYEMQGVVYNEMKGSYSSFDSVATDYQIRSLFPDANYAYDSGGDPIEIPSFTYEQFKEFHKKYYSPDNAILFLYGNIPTEEQLDFIQEKFLDRLEKKYSQAVSYSSYPHVNEEFVKMETPSAFGKCTFLKKTAPSSGSDGSLVTVSWNCGKTSDLDSYMECAFLSEVLTGNDGSPLAKVLLDSDLGDELAPLSGTVNDTRFFTVSFGLHGVKAKNVQKVYDLIFECLRKIEKEGVDKNHIEAAIMSAEFANREVVRSRGPFSLVLLDRALNSWNYGEEPYKGLLYRSSFEKIRQNCEKDPAYIQKLLKKYILDNPECVCLQVEPDDSYFIEREKSEKNVIEKFASMENKEELQKSLEALHKYQQYHENEKEVSCIPRLDISDLNTEAEKSVTDLSFLAAGKGQIPLFKNIENTNGILYLDLLYPLDQFEAENYKYFNLFSYLATNCGWNGKDWAECSLEAGKLTGGINVRILSRDIVKSEKSRELYEKYKDFNFCGRDWIVFSVSLLSEKLEEGLSLFEESVKFYEFKDLKRIKNLIGEVKSVLKSSVVPNGNRYATIRAQCSKSHSGAVDELTRGFKHFLFINSLSEKSAGKLSVKFQKMKEKIFAGGGMIHFTSDQETALKFEKLLPGFVKNLQIKELIPFKGYDEEAFKKELLLPGEKNLSDKEIFVVPSQVGFASCSIDSAYFGSRENASELLFAHWLSGNLLWERIRTSGGAYGASAFSENCSGQFLFSTFRDPSPFKSVETYKSCLSDSSEMEISEEECQRSIIGTYGEEISPNSPSGKGRINFYRMIYCISDEERSAKLKYITKLSPKDMKETAFKLSEKSSSMRIAVVCSQSDLNKSIKKSGTIVKLHL